ncbi:hypothetical protein TcWFU_004910 [Taenia crassiceps]|uniref:Uncharacterized protein n=1 Tax=Taenia crassiceps TaxID=6207 RepID=A0ABR4QE01_9CEST
MVAVAEGLRFCHDLGHFSSYTKAIIASTVILRSALAGPLYAFTERNHALVVTAYHKSALETSNPVPRDGKIDSGLQRALFRRTFTENCQKLRCHPLKSALFGMIQLPVWMTATFGLRNACGHQVTPFLYWPPMIPEFVTEGLTSPTTSLCLLAATTFVTALNVEISHLRRVYAQAATTAMALDPKFANQNYAAIAAPTRLPWQLKFAHRIGHLGTLLIALFSSFAPSALVIFWCTSSSHQLMLHLLCLSNRARGFLGIAKTPADPKRPYLALWRIAKSRYRILRLIGDRG